MSDIKKGERADSKLKAQHQAYRVREMITAELMASFAYSDKKLEKHIKQITAHIADENDRITTSKKIWQMEEDFSCWFIREERARISQQPHRAGSQRLQWERKDYPLS